METKTVLCRDFWNQAPEGVLFEIFIRLPDCRTAVQLSTVCRLWRSLILGNPQFIPRFKSQHHQHGDRYAPGSPYIIMFRKGAIGDKFFPEPGYFQPIFQLYSEEWMFLNGKSSSRNCLDFLPSPRVIIRAAFTGLLLASPGPRWTDDHYVCNPITKRFVQLPLIPTHGIPRPRKREGVGYALVCTPPSHPTSRSRFKVVVFILPDHPLPPGPIRRLPFTVAVFCSESRKWERRRFYYPRPWTMCYTFTLITVACNGIVYWLEHGRPSDRIVYLDLEKDQCGAIAFPPYDNDNNQHHVFGVVQVRGGEFELRLIRVFNMSVEDPILLKVWRLNNSNNTWVLVHNVTVELPDSIPEGHQFVDTYVHPTNGDSVIMVWGQYVVEYDLVNEAIIKIGNQLREAVKRRHLLIPFPVVSYGASYYLDNAEL